MLFLILCDIETSAEALFASGLCRPAKMKITIPFFPKSRSKKEGNEVHLSSQSSSDSNCSVSSSFSSDTSSPPLSFRDKMTPQEKKRMEKLKKRNSVPKLRKEKSGSLWGFRSSQRQSSRGSSGRQASFDLTKELTETFRYFDRNGDGKISATELGHVLTCLGIKAAHEELEAMVSAVDFDSDGYIKLDEFIKLNMLALEATEGVQGESKSMEEAFEVFDLDGDGYISAAELHRVLSGLGEAGLTLEDCRTMIMNVDQDGDGLVNLAEFKWLMHDPIY